MGDLKEEPEQRWQAYLRQQRGEKIRILALALALPALLTGLLPHLFTGMTLPLFATMVLTYLGYQGIEIWLKRRESPGY